MKEFRPVDEAQRPEFEAANIEVAKLNAIIRDMPSKEQRVAFLKKANPNNHCLKWQYEIARQKEDYEVCEAAKVVLEERGLRYVGE